MKKMTLLAAMAVCGMGAMNAQYIVEPGIERTTSTGAIYDVVVLNDATIAELQQAGKTVNDLRVDETNVCTDVWEKGETLQGGSAIGPGVDGNMDGYPSWIVGNAGWSGGGLRMVAGYNMDCSHFTDDTHFHCAIKAGGSGLPASLALIVLDDKTDGFLPAKIAVGTAFNDGGAIYPTVGSIPEGGDWAAVDITFGDLKRFYPTFSYSTTSKFASSTQGYVISYLGGSVAGQGFDLDAVYFYTPANGSVEGVAADEVDILVSDKTVSVLGGKDGIELYNISGQLVKKVANTVMGIEDLNAGIYVVKAGNAVKKVVIR